MRNLFDEDSQMVSEYEMAINEERQPARPEPRQQQVKRQSQPQPYEQHVDSFIENYQHSTNSIAYDLEEEEQDIVGEAMIRLEQARLYDMLIKHNFFDGVEANKIALENVQNELKTYIVGRLQVLLGIAQDTTLEPQSMRIEMPFNRLEIQALKDLAYKLTKGASQDIEENETVEVIKEERVSKIKPLAKLQSIKSVSKPQTFKQEQQPTRQTNQTPKQNTHQSNVRVNSNKRKIELPRLDKPIMGPNGEVITAEEMEMAREQLQEELERGVSKDPYDMNPEELIERSKKIKGQTISKKVKRIPMPSQDQVNSMYSQRAAQKQNNSENVDVANIVDIVLNRK